MRAILLSRVLLGEVRTLLSPPPVVAILATLLAIALLLLLMHAILVYLEYHAISTARHFTRFNMELDGSFTELFEYVLNAVCIAMLAACWLRTQQPLFLALCAVFLFTLADNALHLHEHFGEAVAPLLHWSARYIKSAPHALGELIFYAVLGPALLLLVVVATLHTRKEFRACGAVFLLLLLLLGGFGVGVDLVHSLLLDLVPVDSWTMKGGPWDRVLGFVEDGGELVILSLTCALSCGVRLLLSD